MLFEISWMCVCVCVCVFMRVWKNGNSSVFKGTVNRKVLRERKRHVARSAQPSSFVWWGLQWRI